MGALEPHRGDFYAYETLLPEDEQKEILRLREFLEHEVRPIADEYWAEAEFPRHLIAPLRGLDLVGGAYEGFRDPPFSRLFSGFTSLEMSRVDPSFGTFFGVHAGLAFASIFHCGSPAQRGRWLPGMADLTAIGAFALTEPDHGSDIAGGLATTARRDGDHWVLNGKKRWIGNGTFADLVVVWARRTADGRLRDRARLHVGARAVRAAAGRVPARPGPPGHHAVEHHDVARCRGPPRADAGRGDREGRARRAGQGDGFQPDARDGRHRPRGDGRQRDPARTRVGPVLRGRRGGLLLRGHPRGEPADRRPGDHRHGCLRLSRLPVRGR